MSCTYYCLDDRSIVESKYRGLYEYIRKFNKQGSFMRVCGNSVDFIVSECCEYIISRYSNHNDDADILIMDDMSTYGDREYVGIASSKKIAPLMDVRGLTDDEIFDNMVKLRKYLCAFVDNIERFDDNYCDTPSKNAYN